ncbi:hypothetical protein [Staphylococcus pseudintermedius]|nr:hypothetical protein [Staphylococcus phage phiSP119-1]
MLNAFSCIILWISFFVCRFEKEKKHFQKIIYQVPQLEKENE